jgi:hypothetical protein
MIAVAIIHFDLVRREDFSIWYGGGFGMFASLDGPSTRFLTVTEHISSHETVLDLSDYATDIRRIQVYPKRSLIEDLLEKVCVQKAQPAARLSASLFKIHYDLSTQTVSSVLSSEVKVDCG